MGMGIRDGGTRRGTTGTEQETDTMNIQQIIEVTATLIMAFLILSNAGNFATAVSAAASAFTGAVTTLQGR